MEYEAVIGLEVHAQIHTRSKMFCSCPVVEDTGDVPPNTHVCPVCLALPGALPVVNRRAVEIGILTGLALNCTANPVNVFSRKSYFYPDLPKGYQISQYDLPLAVQGVLEIEVDGEMRRIGITRVHLEEDTAKLYHTIEDSAETGAVSVDFNRAGVPLLEIVSEPELHSAAEVQAYATTLRDMLVYLGVNSGDMEKGVMRFEANVSVRPAGERTLGARVEIKNLNSFRALSRSVEYEIKRQSALLESGETVEQETVGWNDGAGCTYSQRSKEEAHDYRYFPEPDIPPLVIEPGWITQIKTLLPELPLEKRQRLMSEYGIRRYDAELLVSRQATAAYFEEAVAMGRDINIEPQDIANWIAGELLRYLNETGCPIESCLVTPEHLVSLLFLLQKGAISSTAAKKVLSEVFKTGEVPNAVVKRLGLAQISDEAALGEMIAQVIAANPAQVQQYRDGKETVLGWLVGQVMRVSNGKANPQQVRELLLAALTS
ncbi:MAG: Asp-tRNA(Asn)/Glu-tRNA(Gln) amidotransferase subunit GatB [Anaerolineae bacterium]|nr:Asp-tRNA(Asn)/Glu-tRNA(Gln) amidotransferase subunit GatB [Anaerolineae bacterium]